MPFQYLHWFARQRPVAAGLIQRWRWSTVLKMFLGFGCVAAFLGLFYAATCGPRVTGLHSLRVFAGKACVATVTALLLELIGFCSVLNLQLRTAPRNAGEHEDWKGSRG